MKILVLFGALVLLRTFYFGFFVFRLILIFSAINSETDTLVVNIHGVPNIKGRSGHAPGNDDPSTFFNPHDVNHCYFSIISF